MGAHLGLTRTQPVNPRASCDLFHIWEVLLQIWEEMQALGQLLLPLVWGGGKTMGARLYVPTLRGRPTGRPVGLGDGEFPEISPWEARSLPFVQAPNLRQFARSLL